MDGSIDEKDGLDKGQDEIKETIKDIKNTEDRIQLLENGYKKIHDESSKRYYELSRLRMAMGGARMNFAELSSSANSVIGLERVPFIRESCIILGQTFEKEKQVIDHFGREMDGFTRPESLSANGTQILYGSTALFENNAPALHLSPIPPSVREQIDSYSEDQPQIVEELKELLKGVDPELESLYSATKEVFETPIRSRLEAASANLRTLIWEIYRELAPHEKVTVATGFKPIKDDPKIATYRQRIAYILTGTAETDGPDANLIGTIFEDLHEALKVFSAKTKSIANRISDHQVKKTMAQAERALLSLLKSRKI